MQGVVKRVNGDKFFGFILGDDGSEYFFHASECHSPFTALSGGTRVEFSPDNTPKGLRAREVNYLRTQNERKR